ncbi:MAG: hypothetical protein ACLPV4_07635 [Solirubrobacteraceae bacterium]
MAPPSSNRAAQLELPLSAPAARPVQRPTRSPRPWDPSRVQELRERLAHRLGETVRLEIHDNRSTMISYRRERGTLALRVHHMFLSADERTTQALADFASARRHRRQAGQLLDNYIRRNQVDIRPPGPMDRLEPRGRVHDLDVVYRSINARFFGGSIDARIGWGRAPLHRRRRTIKMGVYYHDTRTIRIHPALDHQSVPPYVVEFIVYHEMLHQACPTETTSSGQKRIHTRAFRAREHAHPDHDRALAWEKEHLAQLLSRRRS